MLGKNIQRALDMLVVKVRALRLLENDQNEDAITYISSSTVEWSLSICKFYVLKSVNCTIRKNKMALSFINAQSAVAQQLGNDRGTAKNVRL